MGSGCECWVGSGIADWGPAFVNRTTYPFMNSSLGSWLQEESFRRLRRSGEPFQFQTRTLTVHMTLFYHFYIFLLVTDCLNLVQTTWEHACVLGLIVVPPRISSKDPMSENHLSFGKIRDCKIMSNLPQDIRQKEHSKSSNNNPDSQYSHSHSASIYWLCWVSILLILLYHFTSIPLFLSSQPFHYLIYRREDRKSVV